MVNERIIILGVISDWLIVGQLAPALQPQEVEVDVIFFFSFGF